MASFSDKTGALVLAAGKGTRMHSARPKVLHTLLGETMLDLVLAALKPLFPRPPHVVIGHEAEQVRNSVAAGACKFVEQKEQLGTGHALLTSWQALKEAGVEYVLVVNGDVPLIREETLRAFMSGALENGADLAFLSMTLDNPGSFGRVMRDGGNVKAILEAKDYNPAVHGPEPKEVNSGIYFIRLNTVEPLLKLIGNNNGSREYYITDLVELAVTRRLKVAALDRGDCPELLGINSPLELSDAEERMRAVIVRSWQERGVLIRNCRQVRVGPFVRLEPGSEICGPCEIYGQSWLESGVAAESHLWAKNVSIGSGSLIRPFCHFEDARIGPRCIVGPYARLRPGSVMEEGSHVGNFVEMKKSRLGKGSKANHLTYLGDAEIGDEANIGAGTITCNYDGVRKHVTRIGNKAFIGSNTALVAPVEVADGALVGAGSVITKNVPEGNLAVARGKQVNIKKMADGRKD